MPELVADLEQQIQRMLHVIEHGQAKSEAIAFLSSDRAAMITGHTLPVDGGFLAQ